MKLPRRKFLVLLFGALVSMTGGTTTAEGPLVFISAFTGDEGAIHAYRLDLESGGLNLLHRTDDVKNPFFMALSPDRKYLYSIHTGQFGGEENEEIAAYRIAGDSGELELLNRQSALGTAACYLDIDATGRTVLVANYSSGSVAALPVNSDGSLGEATSFIEHAGSSVEPRRQQAPHAHCIVISPDNRFAFAADLGTDRVVCYRLEAEEAKLTPARQAFVRTPPGAGPRHLAFHPDGESVYVINELGNSITLFEYDPEPGVLFEKQTIGTLPDDFDGRSHCADLKITPDGRFLYGTNRGHDSIAAFRIGEEGELTLIGIEPSLGQGPQNLAITAGGEFLLCANMPGKNVAVFRIDPGTGHLRAVEPPTPMPSPACILLMP